MRSHRQQESHSPPDPARSSPRPSIGWRDHASQDPRGRPMRVLEGVAEGGEEKRGEEHRHASIGPLGEGRSRCFPVIPTAAMSLSRLCRLLKPALLCGALAAPGLASTMVSVAPAAGLVGRWGGRAAFLAARGAALTLGRGPRLGHTLGGCRSRV